MSHSSGKPRQSLFGHVWDTFDFLKFQGFQDLLGITDLGKGERTCAMHFPISNAILHSKVAQKNYMSDLRATQLFSKTETLWTFRIFFIFFAAQGGGRGSPRRRWEGGGSIFY